MKLKSLFRLPKAALAAVASVFVWGRSPYESANLSDSRSPAPGVRPRDEKLDLVPYIRQTLVKNSRYLMKNSGFVREMVGNMAMYSTGDGILIQGASPDQDWNTRAGELFKDWSGLCEVTERFSLAEVENLICRAVDYDGGYFVVKTRDEMGEPKIQLLEVHRVGDVPDKDDTVDGIGLSPWGAPRFYRVLLDDGGFEDVPASSVMHIFEPESVSLVRNAPVIQHSINNIQDKQELLSIEKKAVKDNGDVSRTITTETGEVPDDQDFDLGEHNDGNESSDPISLQKITGGKLVALKPGEKLETYESKRPSPTFTGFLESLDRDSALGVLPYEFTADSSKVGGAGVRLVVNKADRRFSWRQQILMKRFLSPLWFYVIGDYIDRGIIESIPGWWKITCTTPRRITVDAGREGDQNRNDVEAGLKTLTDHFAENGSTLEHEMDRRGLDAQIILATAKKYEVPVNMLWNPTVQPKVPPGAVDNQDQNAGRTSGKSSAP